MPKRGAEKELNKDNADQEEEDENPSTGFVKANDAEISRRQIAGLPRRAQSSSRIAPPNPPPAQFTGFGTSPSSSFTPSSASFPPPSLPVTSTATSTAKSFASFLGTPPSATPSVPSQSALSITPPSFTAPPAQDDPSFKYYISLRGLNVSLMDALSKATEEDPFSDISDILDQYKSLRLTVQKEFDEKSKKSSPPASVPEKPATVPAPPAPPSGGFKGFGGFGAPSSSSSAPTSLSGSIGGFQPKLTATPSASSNQGFSFSTPPTKTDGAANPFAPPSSSSTSTSPFGSSTTSSANPFALPEKDSSASSPFSFNKTSSSADKNTPSSNPFTFGSSTLESGDKSSSSFDTTPKSGPSPFVFGNTASTPSFGSSTGSVFGTTGTTSRIFGSSDSSSPPKSQTFGLGGFGKPAGSTGSIGNPVGFVFGASPKTPGADSGTSEADSVDKEGEIGTPDSQTGNGAAAEGSVGLITNNPHDEEGEGEEEEETVHDARLKVYRLDKKDTGSSWADMGVGVLRVKKHKLTSARRILLRNSGTGKIIMNFKLYSGLKPTQSKKSLTFVGHDDKGSSQTFSVRLPNEDLATALREVLEREVASLEAD